MQMKSKQAQSFQEMGSGEDEGRECRVKIA